MTSEPTPRDLVSFMVLAFTAYAVAFGAEAAVDFLLLPLEMFGAAASTSSEALVPLMTILVNAAWTAIAIAVLAAFVMGASAAVSATPFPVAGAYPRSTFSKAAPAVYRVEAGDVDCDYCEETRDGYRIYYGRDVVAFGMRLPAISKVEGANRRCKQCIEDTEAVTAFLIEEEEAEKEPA